MLLLKLALLVGGLAVGLLGASRSRVARFLLRPVGPRTDAANLSRGELLSAARQLFGFALLAFALLWIASSLLDRNPHAPDWQVGTFTFAAFVFLILGVWLACKAVALGIRGLLRRPPAE